MQTFCQVGNSVIKTFHLIRFSGGMTLGWYWDENIWSHQLSLGCKLFVCDQSISSHRILSRCDNWKGFYLAIIKKWSYLVMILHELDNHPEVVGVVFDGNHLGLVLLHMSIKNIVKVLKFWKPAWCWRRPQRLGPGSTCWPEEDKRRPLSTEMDLGNSWQSTAREAIIYIAETKTRRKERFFQP